MMSSNAENVPIPYGPERKPWIETLSDLARSPEDGKLLVTPPSRDPLDQYKKVYSTVITGSAFQLSNVPWTH